MMSQRQHGFTLLELLIAIGIFSLLSIMAFSGMNIVLDNKEHLDKELQRLAQVQRSVLTLSRDIEQTIDRSIRDELGAAKAAVIGGQNIDSTVLELTRSGWNNPARHNRSHLQRVAYGVEDNQLIRLYWYHLDHTQTSEPVRRVLLDQVEEVQVRFLDKEWSDAWPPLNINQTDTVISLPRAIEVSITLSDWGKITRLYKVGA